MHDSQIIHSSNPISKFILNMKLMSCDLFYILDILDASPLKVLFFTPEDIFTHENSSNPVLKRSLNLKC